MNLFRLRCSTLPKHFHLAAPTRGFYNTTVTASSPLSPSLAAFNRILRPQSSMPAITQRQSPLGEMGVKEVKSVTNLPWFEHPSTCKFEYIRSTTELDRALGSLRGTTFGFDCEWRPQRRKNITHKVSMIQITDGKKILLIHLPHIKSGFPTSLREWIENPTLLKAGVNIQGDGTKLHTDYGIMAEGLVELSLVARSANTNPGYYNRDVGMISLAELTEKHLGCKLLKDSPTRCANWEALSLPEKMLKYAANDVYASWKLYEVLATQVGEQSEVDAVDREIKVVSMREVIAKKAKLGKKAALEAAREF